MHGSKTYRLENLSVDLIDTYGHVYIFLTKQLYTN
jgi:hypothetical protein